MTSTFVWAVEHDMPLVMGGGVCQTPGSEGYPLAEAEAWAATHPRPEPDDPDTRPPMPMTVTNRITELEERLAQLEQRLAQLEQQHHKETDHA